MKYIAFIVLGLVLLAAIAGVVLWANMPTAKLTVHAVRPMGTNVSWKASPHEEVSWPVWEVAVTNNGRVLAYWFTDAVKQNSDAKPASGPLETYVAAIGSLSPGQWTNVYMPLASPSNSVWAVGLQYYWDVSPLERGLSLRLKAVPKVRRLLPYQGLRRIQDVWHTGTNVVTTR